MAVQFLLDNIDYSSNAKYEYTLILTTKNRTPIAILSEAFNREYSATSESFNTLKFDISEKLIDSQTHQQVKNLHYNKILEENLILLLTGNPANPLRKEYFVIKTVQQKSDTYIKHVETSSLEISLNKFLLTTSALQRPLYDTVSKDGILNLLEQETSWKVGYISPSALIDIINGGTVPKVRYLSAQSQSWYQFLHDTISVSFNVIFQYDSFNKLINVYDRDTYGIKTPLLLSESNYIMDINRTTKTDNIVTKLTVSGSNGLDITSINIFGDSSIYNYSYFINNGQMSDSLINAWNTYQSVLATQNTIFQGLVTQLNTLNTNLTSANSSLTTLKETLKGQLGIQQAYISSGDNTNLPTATVNVNTTNASITTQQNTINSLNSQITSLQSQMTTITNNIQKTNVKDTNGNLIFNTDLLNELGDWTLEENWSDSTQTAPNLLMQAGQRTLADYCVPEIQYSMTLIDMLALSAFQQYQGCLNIGDFVTTYSERLGIQEWTRIINYTYNIDTNALSITFSNKNKNLQNAKGIASKISKTANTANIVNTSRYKWDEMSGVADAVNIYMNNAFDCAKQEVLANNGKNRIDITENGMNITDTDNTNNQVRILSGLIAITQDGWNSVQTAIDATGVFASQIIGSLVAGNKLVITNANGSVVINGTSITIKDQNNTTVLSAKGVANSYTVWANDNVDGSHPLTIRFRIDDNVNQINQVLLNLSYQAFRAYETGAASGGAPTSASTIIPSTTSDNSTNWGSGWAYNISSGKYLLYTTPDGAQQYIFQNSLMHNHVVSFNPHSHNIDSHTHNMVFGIYEGRTTGNTAIYVDGILAAGGNITSDSVLNLTSYVTVKGWHSIVIVADGLGRVAAGVYIKSYIGM